MSSSEDVNSSSTLNDSSTVKICKIKTMEALTWAEVLLSVWCLQRRQDYASLQVMNENAAV